MPQKKKTALKFRKDKDRHELEEKLNIEKCADVILLC